MTCSVLRAENEDRIAAFLERHDDFLPVDAAAQAPRPGLPCLPNIVRPRPRLPPQPENDRHRRLLHRDAGADARGRPLPPQIAFWVDSVLVSGPWSY